MTDHKIPELDHVPLGLKVNGETYVLLGAVDYRIKQLEEALRFYAESSDGHVHLDGGEIARAALAGEKKDD